MVPTFRTYHKQDLPHLLTLMTQLGYSRSADSLATTIKALHQAGGEIFVAELDDGIHGCVSAIIDVRLAEGVQGEIVSLVVSEQARGKGLGKGLVNTAETWLAQHTDTIRVRANEIRTDAHAFYRNLGYTSTKSQVIFEKQIAS